MYNFKIIYHILCFLEKSMDLEEVDTNRISAESVGISEQRWIAIMDMLREEKLIDGLTVERCTDRAVAVFGEHPRITLRGLEYLEERHSHYGASEHHEN